MGTATTATKYPNPAKLESAPSPDSESMASMKVLEQMFRTHSKHFKRNECIFRTGDSADGVYFVRSGLVKLESFGPDGQGHILRLYGPMELFGYRAWLAKESYRSNATAQEDSEICRVDGADFAEVLSHSPELAATLLVNLSRELASAEARMCALTDKDVRERVAESLLFLEHRSIQRQWTRKEIAEWAGTTPESVMRTLAQFESEGLIQVEGRRINILEAKQLRLLSQSD